MSLKQTAFNFEFSEQESKPVSKKLVPPTNITIEETEPIELDVRSLVVERYKSKTTTLPKSKRGRMKLSDMASSVNLVEIPEDEILFSKRYYSIGVVSEMFKVNHSLIRFWENEFDILKPKKNGKGDRLFRPEDIKNLKIIYSLLRERKFTIDGAKEFLKKSKNTDNKYEMISQLKNLKSFLHELKTGL
jgi:DNA-binding transcriptional MerR regulator